MDAVGLAIPAAVAVSKLMGPEGFNGGTGGGGGEVQSVAASVLIKPSIKACSSLVSKKEPALWNKMPDPENCSQSSSFHEKDSFKDINFGSTKTSIALVSGLEANQLQRKSSKVARTSSGSSKRSRTVQMEISMSESVVEDVKGSSNEPATCDVSEKSHMPKQKNNSNSKRGDKRNGKVPKSRGDSFCLKNGLVSFSSAAGGNNFLGVCSSKTDLFDVTKQADELSLNELLDGSYQCPIYAKDKGKKVTNSNESLLRSVGKAWSILRLQKCVEPQNNGEVDNSCKHKASAGLFSSGSSSVNRNDFDKGDTLVADMPSRDKVQELGENLKIPAIMVDLLSHQPKDVLKRLALPPPKDLDSLLLDTAKPALSSRNSADLRLGKPVSHRTGLSPFPWSHSSSAHCKSGPDAVKLSTARNTCQGRWVKVENSITRSEESSGFLVNLESLTFDQRLVPSAGPESGPSEIEKAPSASASFPSSNQVLLSSAGCSTSHGQPGDEHTPRLLAAAQTLYEIAISSKKQNPNGTIKWLKKPSEKIMKTCKLKANEKSEYQFVVPKSTTRPDSLAKADVMFPSKKLKFSVDVKFTDINHTNTAKKGPINWSAPRSIRSSPSKLFRESIVEMKNCNTNVVNKSCMMPPPPRVMDKACSSQQKLRKVVTMDLNRSGSKLN